MIMWKLYKYNGHYIMGDLISSHKTESAAMKKAKKELTFKHTEKEKKSTGLYIWLDDQNHAPVGVIFQKKTDKKGV